MPVSYYGTLGAAAISVAGALAGPNVVPTYVFQSGVVLFICFAIHALLKREFTRIEPNRVVRKAAPAHRSLWVCPQRCCRLVRAGYAIFALTALASLADFAMAWAVPQRWTALALAAGLVPAMVGHILRGFVTPLDIAIKAAYQLRVEQEEALARAINAGLLSADGMDLPRQWRWRDASAIKPRL